MLVLSLLLSFVEMVTDVYRDKKIEKKWVTVAQRLKQACTCLGDKGNHERFVSRSSQTGPVYLQ